jgi:hypothetical protein
MSKTLEERANEFNAEEVPYWNQEEAIKFLRQELTAVLEEAKNINRFKIDNIMIFYAISIEDLQCIIEERLK